VNGAQLTQFGRLLRQWRRARRSTQMDLAFRAGVSTRHISFIETGRSKPSRDMVLALSTALRVPLRDGNTLLQAAGYAPLYAETRLDDPQMADMLRALRLILRQQGPTGGAVAFDRRWDIVMANETYVRFLRALLGVARVRIEPLEVLRPPRPNVLRLLFDPEGVRPHVVNWDVVARELLARLSEEAAWSQDAASRELVEGLLAYPGVPRHWREAPCDRATSLVTPLEIRTPKGTVRLFSTTTTLGTPRDITLQELRIDSFHAADEQSRQTIRALLGAA